jgi:hypothetical protein
MASEVSFTRDALLLFFPWEFFYGEGNFGAA